jgi:predicted N-formylglutamate amidohydrolase
LFVDVAGSSPVQTCTPLQVVSFLPLSQLQSRKPKMNDFPPYDIIEGNYEQGMILLADHAMNLVPLQYANLGLPQTAFERHIGHDIGVEYLTRNLAAQLGVPAVMSRFSRLLIDPNRGEDDPTLIMKISDGAIIPGNHPFSEVERQSRLDQYHRPYHNAVSAMIDKVAKATGRAPLVISLHSFTPLWKNFVRPWHAAVLWDTDERAVRPLIDALEQDPELIVGDNEPYDGALKGDTMYRHCMVTGIPHVLLEVRQDLIADKAGIDAWADRLAPIFAQMNAMDHLHNYEVIPSRTGPYQ